MRKQIQVLAFLFSTIFFISCSGGDDSPVSDDDGTPTDPNLPVAYEIGDIGRGGGTVFYVDESNQHGLELSGVVANARWLNNNENPYYIEGLQDGLGTGMENTNKIVAALGSEGTYAAKLCSDFVQGGKDDWYLPSKAELEKIYYLYKYTTDCPDCSIFENLWSSSVKYATNFEGQLIISGVWTTDFGMPASWPEIIIFPDTPYADGGLSVRAVRTF